MKKGGRNCSHFSVLFFSSDQNELDVHSLTSSFISFFIIIISLLFVSFLLVFSTLCSSLLRSLFSSPHSLSYSSIFSPVCLNSRAGVTFYAKTRTESERSRRQMLYPHSILFYSNSSCASLPSRQSFLLSFSGLHPPRCTRRVDPPARVKRSADSAGIIVLMINKARLRRHMNQPRNPFLSQ